MSFGSGAAAIAAQTTGGVLAVSDGSRPNSCDSEQHGRPEPALDVMLERADTEMLDLVRGRSRRLCQRTVAAATEPASQPRQPAGRERTATATRARTADSATLFEVERDQLVIAALCFVGLLAAARAAVE